LFEDDVPPAFGAWLGNVDLVALVVQQLGLDNVALELGLSDLACEELVRCVYQLDCEIHTFD
jgi:hypothetical protein